MYEQAMVAVVLLPAVLVNGYFASARGIDILMILLLGLFCTAIAHTTLITSMKAIPAQLVGICNSMETVYAIALAAILLGESPTINEVIGAIIVTIVVVSAQLEKE